jgi:threonine dehydrogenase-like Zn-dependent dehydrogenase
MLLLHNREKPMLRFKAAVAMPAGGIEIQEFTAPEVKADNGLMKIDMTGVCGSDWGYFKDLPRSRGPVILGHETVGTVQALGAIAQAKWGVREGDLVALEEYLPCGHCNYCRSGDFRLCDATDWRLGGMRYGASGMNVGSGLWGGYSQYQELHLNTVFHKVPSGVSAKHAALALPISNGIEWTYLHGKAGPGKTVLIQGPGQQGLACVIAAKEAGAEKIIVTGLSTPSDKVRLALAKRLGAHHTIDIGEQDLLETTADITGGAMADLVIDCASGGTASIVSAMQLARKKGTVILGGIKSSKVPNFDSDMIISKFLTVKGMRGHSYESVELALQLIAGNRHNVTAMSTHTFGLAQTEYAIRTLVGEGAQDAVHMTVDPWA